MKYPTQDATIIHVYRNSNNANIMTIPKRMALRKGLQGPTQILVQEMEDGIFIRKLDLEELKKI